MRHDKLIFPMRRRGATGTTGAAGTGAASIQAEVDRLNNPTDTVQFYVDPVNGNDSNSGLSPSAKVRTWARMGELFRPGCRNIVFIHDDIIADSFISLFRVPAQIFIYGRNQANTAYVTHTITVRDASNIGSRTGGIGFYGACCFYWTGLNIVMDSSRGFSFFEARGCTLSGRFNGLSFSRTGTGTADVFAAHDGSAMIFTFTNHSLDSSIPGYFMSGVSAAQDPNIRHYYHTNITSG